MSLNTSYNGSEESPIDFSYGSCPLQCGGLEYGHPLSDYVDDLRDIECPAAVACRLSLARGVLPIREDSLLMLSLFSTPGSPQQLHKFFNNCRALGSSHLGKQAFPNCQYSF